MNSTAVANVPPLTISATFSTKESGKKKTVYNCGNKHRRNSNYQFNIIIKKKAENKKFRGK